MSQTIEGTNRVREQPEGTVRALQKPPKLGLPPDVLICVFEQCIEYTKAVDIQRPDRRSAPLNVSQVCRLWRDISVSTPTLWRGLYIRGDVSYNLLSEFFRRSSTVTLDVHLRLDCDESSTSSTPTSKAMGYTRTEILEFIQDLVLQEQRRWRSVYIHSTLPLHHGEDIFSSGTGPLLRDMCNIQELTLDTGRRWRIKLDLSMALGIHSLVLSGYGIFIRVSFPTLASLRRLKLRLGRRRPFNTYQSLIKSAPNLEYLFVDLSNCAISQLNESSSITYDRARAYLPHLRYLFFYGGWNIPTDRITSRLCAILNTIEADNLTGVHISGYAATPTYTEALVRFLEVSGKCLVNVVMRVRVDTSCFLMASNYLPTVRRLVVVLEELNCEVVAAMHIKEDTKEIRLPQLQELAIECLECHCNADDLLEMLLSRTYDEEDCRKDAYKSLEKVSITGFPPNSVYLDERYSLLKKRGCILNCDFL